jgi:hypothetical protein
VAAVPAAPAWDRRFSDFDVEVPFSPIALSVEDHGTIEW